MRTFAAAAVAAFTLALCCPGARADCPPGQGPYARQYAVCPDGTGRLEWREYASQPGMYYLHDLAGNRVGAWKEATCQYWPLDPRTWAWGAECRPPCPLPLSARRPSLNFGLVTDRIGKEGPRYLIGGRPVPKEKVYEALEAGKLEDDSHKLRVTVFGSPERTKPAAEAVAGSDVGKAVLVQAYRPDDPMVKGLGFKADADPTVYVQTPAGKVLHRGPGGQPAQVVEAVRKANGSYDPSKDPDLTKPAPPLNVDFGQVPQWVWGAAGALALMLLAPTRKEK